MNTLEWKKENFTVTTDPKVLQIERVHAFLTESYWAENIPIELVRKSVENSLNFGIIEEISQMQIGFARVVSDFATFAYLGDVYIEKKWRGLGLSKWLMECITQHPELQGLRRFCLGTRDAHKLYAKYGFQVIAKPENWMEIRVNDIYKTRPSS